VLVFFVFAAEDVSRRGSRWCGDFSMLRYTDIYSSSVGRR